MCFAKLQRLLSTSVALGSCYPRVPALGSSRVLVRAGLALAGRRCSLCPFATYCRLLCSRLPGAAAGLSIHRRSLGTSRLRAQEKMVACAPVRCFRIRSLAHEPVHAPGCLAGLYLRGA